MTDPPAYISLVEGVPAGYTIPNSATGIVLSLVGDLLSSMFGNETYSSTSSGFAISTTATSSLPTNVPGQGGLPGFAMVLKGDGQGCPGVDYCKCGGTNVPVLTTTVSGTRTSNCEYTIQVGAFHSRSPDFPFD